MRKKRKKYSGEEKVSILRSHLLDRCEVSDLCEKHGMQPTVFYRWQKEFFENGALAFETKNKRLEQARKKKVSILESKLIQKNEVMAELMESHVCLKKKLGLI